MPRPDRSHENCKYYEILLQGWTGLRRPAKTEYVWVSKAWFISVYCGIVGFESISVTHSQTHARLSNSENFCEDCKIPLTVCHRQERKKAKGLRNLTLSRWPKCPQTNFQMPEWPTCTCQNCSNMQNKNLLMYQSLFQMTWTHMQALSDLPTKCVWVTKTKRTTAKPAVWGSEWKQS